MTTSPSRYRDPIVPPDHEFYQCASVEPAWDRARHDIAAERYWGLGDYYRAAAIREYTQGEAPGDRAPCPPGPAAAEADRYFSATVGNLRPWPGELYEAAAQDPSASRAMADGVDEFGLGWTDYLQSAAIRQHVQGEAPGDRDPSPTPADLTRGYSVIAANALNLDLVHPGYLHDVAAEYPAANRTGPDASNGWADYCTAAAIREATSGEVGQCVAPWHQLDHEAG